MKDNRQVGTCESLIQVACFAIICSASFTFCYYAYIGQSTTTTTHNNIIIEVPGTVRMVKPDGRRKEYFLNLCSNKYNEEKHVNVLSYSLFGKIAKEQIWWKMIDNVAVEAKSSPLYHDWQVRIHHDGDFPLEQLKLLEKKHTNLRFCDVRNIPHYGDLSQVRGKEWRLIPIGDKTVDIVCVRKLQNVLLQREFDAVEEWKLRSYNRAVHFMRDRPNITIRFAETGLICYRNSNSATLTDILFTIIRNHQKNKNLDPTRDPEEILWQDLILPYIQNDFIGNDAYNCDKFRYSAAPFPNKRPVTSGCDFVGCDRRYPRKATECPITCRHKMHKDWKYC